MSSLVSYPHRRKSSHYSPIHSTEMLQLIKLNADTGPWQVRTSHSILLRYCIMITIRVHIWGNSSLLFLIEWYVTIQIYWNTKKNAWSFAVLLTCIVAFGIQAIAINIFSRKEYPAPIRETITAAVRQAKPIRITDTANPGKVVTLHRLLLVFKCKALFKSKWWVQWDFQSKLDFHGCWSRYRN